MQIVHPLTHRANMIVAANMRKYIQQVFCRTIRPVGPE